MVNRIEMPDTVCLEIRNQISNIILNNHLKYVTGKDSTPASNHVGIKENNFYIHVKCILIVRLNQINLNKLTSQKRLKMMRTFLVAKAGSTTPEKSQEILEQNIVQRY